MAYFERASQTLKQTLLKIYRAEKPMEIDQHFYEFGSIQYHVKFSISDPNIVNVSTSTLLETQGREQLNEISNHINDFIKKIGVIAGLIDIVNPPKLGFQLTLRIYLDHMPRGKEAIKIITRISEIKAIILSNQLKQMVRNVNSQSVMTNDNRPIKIIYHQNKPFYVFKQCEKITALFPMNFKDKSDMAIATSFFQELVEVGKERDMEKAPQCNWSPIPPPQLRGEPVHDLTTNSGFVSFDITPRHIEGKRLDKIVWNLLTFYALVNYHIKCSKGYIQRRMRKRMESLVKMLNNTNIEDEEEETAQKENERCKYVKELVKIPKVKLLTMTKKVKRCKFKIKINGCARFRFNQRWISLPNFSSKPLQKSYTKLD